MNKFPRMPDEETVFVDWKSGLTAEGTENTEGRVKTLRGVVARGSLCAALALKAPANIPGRPTPSPPYHPGARTLHCEHRA